MKLSQVLFENSLVKSMREVRDGCSSGIFSLNGEVKRDPDEEVEMKPGDVLKRGRRVVTRIV